MKNASLKIWSILIACAIAYGVHNQSNAGVITLFVPVEALNLPKDKVILLPKTPQAKVTVRGPSFMLSKLASSPPSFQIELPLDLKDRYDAALQPSYLDIPGGIEVMSIEPSEFEYVFDDKVGKELLVVVPRIGQVSPNVKLTSIEIEPRAVKVVGAKGELSSLKTIETQPLDMRVISESMSTELRLRTPGSFSTADIDTVNVRVNVVSLQVEKTFEQLPIEVRSSVGGSFKANPSFVNVEISGPKKLVARTQSKKIIPYVRVTEELQDASRLQVSVDLPKGLELVVVEPSTVTIQPLQPPA